MIDADHAAKIAYVFNVAAELRSKYPRRVQSSVATNFSTSMLYDSQATVIILVDFVSGVRDSTPSLSLF